MPKPAKTARFRPFIFPLPFDSQCNANLGQPLPKKGLKADAVEKGVEFISLSIRPALPSEPNELSILYIGGAYLAFGVEPTTIGLRRGRTFFLNGNLKKSEDDDWVDSGISYPLNEDYEAMRALDYIVRIDRRNKQWDIYFRNMLSFASIELGRATSSVWVKSSGTGDTELSELRASVDNPMFEDRDVDGIDDAVELELGFLDTVDDRQTYDELGAATNLQHFVNMRKRYSSRATGEVEKTLQRAIALEELGRGDEELAALKIPDEKRERHFTKEEIELEAAKEKIKRRNLIGKPKVEDKSESGIGGDL